MNNLIKQEGKCLSTLIALMLFFQRKKDCWELLFPNWNMMIQKDLPVVVPATKTRFPLSCLLYGTQHNFLNN